MIYTELTAKAMRIAYAAHEGQTDQCGIPYIFHPYHLAEQMDDEIICCAALLHDVVEDTDITLETLEREFPKAVTEAVRLLTHDDAADYADYLKRIRENPIAKKVKLADIQHNSDQSRCAGAGLPEEQLQRWASKYAYALSVLLS